MYLTITGCNSESELYSVAKSQTNAPVGNAMNQQKRAKTIPMTDMTIDAVPS